MKNIFLINAHEPYPFSKGALNAALVDRARDYFARHGYETRLTTMTDDYDVEQEVANHLWADAVVVQCPVNWMGVPWSFKKYQDYVYSAGMDGRLCSGDGRSRSNPELQYGSGGMLKGKQYMLSLTLNAPSASFSDSAQEFFAGICLDDLFRPTHLNFKFFGMKAMETFACYDVMKNPSIKEDFLRFDEHLKRHFPPVQ